MQSLDLAGGGWWRFDRYEVRNGYIRPARGAVLTIYDPWAAYREARAARQEKAAPYQSLLTFIQSLHVAWSARDELRLADWCTEWGLLGILPHMAESVVLAPRWTRFPGHRLSADESPGVAPAQRRYDRTNTGWASRAPVRLWREGEWTVVRGPAEEGMLIPEGSWPSGYARPGVVLREPFTGEYTQQQLSEWWAQYFPDVPEAEQDNYAYPPPLTPEFWQLYAEPVQSFLSVALEFRNALASFERSKPPAELTYEDREAIGVGLKRLHAFVAPVRPSLAPQADGSWRLRWLAPSLLASFAMMALQDIAEQRRVRACATCGTPFASAATPNSTGQRSCNRRAGRC